MVKKLSPLAFRSFIKQSNALQNSYQVLFCRPPLKLTPIQVSTELHHVLSEFYPEISDEIKKLVEAQQKMGVLGGIVMDGRDIGSVVFPHAELKLFVTADPEIRVQRRLAEMQSKGIEMSVEEVRQNLAERDHLDSTRAESPLIQVDDALVLDNSQLTKEEQLDWVLAKVNLLVTD